ncbi:Phosphoenolpyruvate synthase [uncultured archaeon]|nr:Phosphoenolpyruvate synthase [uncultured archaeon]
MESKAILLSGTTVFSGVVAGPLKRIMHENGEFKPQKNAVVVTDYSGPDRVYQMIKGGALGIIFFKGNASSHALLLCKELGVPTIISQKMPDAEDGTTVTLDATAGKLYEGDHAPKLTKKEIEAEPLPTKMHVYGVAGLLETMLKAKKISDGIVPLRAKFLFISMGKHPIRLIGDEGREYVVKELSRVLSTAAKAYGDKPICYRTLDMPTNELRNLIGGDSEPQELNPMIGWRGIRRGLDQKELLETEFLGIKEAVDAGAKNLWVMFPMISDVSEYKGALDIMRQVGLKPREDVKVGIMVEVPSAALTVSEFAKHGLDFIQVGPHDLTQFTLAVDRANPYIAKRFNEHHPAVRQLVEIATKKALELGVYPSICGETFDYEAIKWAQHIGMQGINSSVPLVPRLRETVYNVEHGVKPPAQKVKEHEHNVC